jgi:hypothetical protein
VFVFMINQLNVLILDKKIEFSFTFNFWLIDIFFIPIFHTHNYVYTNNFSSDPILLASSIMNALSSRILSRLLTRSICITIPWRVHTRLVDLLCRSRSCSLGWICIFSEFYQGLIEFVSLGLFFLFLVSMG